MTTGGDGGMIIVIGREYNGKIRKEICFGFAAIVPESEPIYAVQ